MTRPNRYLVSLGAVDDGGGSGGSADGLHRLHVKRVLAVVLAFVGCAPLLADPHDWAYQRASTVLRCPRSELTLHAKDEDSANNMFTICGCGQVIWLYDAYYHQGGVGTRPVPGTSWYEGAPHVPKQDAAECS